MLSIERNVFDFNRHAITASSDSWGYVAHQNLVLRGGGRHARWYREYTHQFDVHGTDNCIGHLNCGAAGEDFVFTENAFQYAHETWYPFDASIPAIKVRGNPGVGALVERNVFVHDSAADAIAQSGGYGDNISRPLELKDNTFGVDSYGQYGVCDFDGDDLDDLFLATGVTWWYASSGKMHWTYLKAASERVHQVGLGDFDGDGRCDVFAVNRFAQQWEISKSGSGAWIALPGTYDIPFEELRFGDFNGDGIMDIFHRAPNGQWAAISPGLYDWTPLASSSLDVRHLRFGDFDADGVTDVLAVRDGRWAVSWSGTTSWEQLNPWLRDPVAGLLIGDMNADGRDDILRYTPADEGVHGTWAVSWGGSTAWVPLATLTWEDSPSMRQQRPAADVRTFVGRFNVWAGDDVLALDSQKRGHLSRDGRGSFAPRMGHLYSYGQAHFAPHSLYAY